MAMGRQDLTTLRTQVSDLNPESGKDDRRGRVCSGEGKRNVLVLDPARTDLTRIWRRTWMNGSGAFAVMTR